MGLRNSNPDAKLGREVEQAALQVTEAVAGLAALQIRMLAVRAQVLANADGRFDDPDDIAWVNETLAGMKTEIQDLANGL